MPGETWTDGEKKIARRVFEAALRRLYAERCANRLSCPFSGRRRKR
jgi:hypothetical protein